MSTLARLGLVLPLLSVPVLIAQSSVPEGSTTASQKPAAHGVQTHEDASPGVQQLAPLIEELLGNNAEIRAARYRFDAANARPPQVSALPEPRVSYTDFGVGHPFSSLNVSGLRLPGHWRGPGGSLSWEVGSGWGRSSERGAKRRPDVPREVAGDDFAA